MVASPVTRALSIQEVEQRRHLASAPLSGRTTGTLRLDPDGTNIHYVVRYVTEAGPQFGAILSGVNSRLAALGAEQLLATFALVLPLGLVVGGLTGSSISRRAPGAVDQLITEVREISDGRGLHRRLVEPRVKDELGRLA